MKRLFYGWNLCALCTLGNLIIQGSAIYSMNAFIEPLNEAYGWSRAATSGCMGIAAFIGFSSAPLIGTLAIRYSTRLMMCLGALLAGLSLFIMGQTNNFIVFTICFSMVWVASQCCGGLVANGLICNWFKRYRGTAFGIACVGMSFAGSIIPIVSLYCITRWDMPTAYAILGGLSAVLFIPCLLFIREHPYDLGLNVDGETGPVQLPKSKSETKAPSFKKFLCMKEIYIIGLGAGLGLMCASGLMSQLKPRFTELGYDAYWAMTFMSIAAISCGLSKFMWGWLADKFRPVRTLRLVMILHVIALGLSLIHFGFVGNVLYCIFMGACCGSYWTLLPAVVGFYFGPQNFLGAYRFVSFFLLLKSLAYPVLGYSYDVTQSYDAGYIVYLGLVALGAFLTFCLNEKNGVEYKKNAK